MRISDWSSDVCSSDLIAPSPLELSDRLVEVHQPLSRYYTLDRDVVVPLPEQSQDGALAIVGGCHRGMPALPRDRKSVVQGKRVSVRLDLGGRRIIKKKQKNTTQTMI